MDRLPEFVQSNPILVMAFVGLTVAIVVNEVRALFRGWKSLSPAQLTDLINRDDALVIDVRGQGDFEKGHILGARHVLPSEVAPTHKLLAKATESPVVVVCAAGMNAPAIAGRLVKAGYKNVGVLDGGIGAWQAAGLPLARGRA
jgi:rhodanese-related sulfurtransferase